jgi:hypothetical protein
MKQTKVFRFMVLGAIFAMALLSTGAALAADVPPTGDPQEECEYYGGTYDAPNCNFPADHELSLENCEAGQTYYGVYSEISEMFEVGGCLGDPTPDPDPDPELDPDTDTSSAPGTSGGGSEEREGRNDDIEDQSLETDKHDDEGPSSFTNFDADACPGWCRVDSHLPGHVGDTPAGTHSTLYVHMVDENQDPYNGSYVACFNTSEVPNPVVYRFVSGAWVALPAYSVTDSQICVSASGDGSFALVNE